MTLRALAASVAVVWWVGTIRELGEGQAQFAVHHFCPDYEQIALSIRSTHVDAISDSGGTWRLAAGVAVPANLAAIYDEAKQVA